MKICKWFIDKNLVLALAKIKALLFASKREMKSFPKLSIKTSPKIHPHFGHASSA